MKYSLKELRARIGKTQSEVAHDLGISTATYNSWEKDLSNVAIAKVFALAQYFNVNLSEKEKYSYAVKQTKELLNGIEDRQGEVVKVILDDTNQKALEGVVKHFVEGSSKHNKKATLNDRRAFATGLIKDTVQNPDVKIIQQAGRPAYITYWRGNKNMLLQVIAKQYYLQKPRISILGFLFLYNSNCNKKEEFQ
ncbi:helix-turn-helix transcriptional regulator [Dialister pneumosintes]|uniref:XRE family transcriptional regulator n=1 Tax=Dialister pneumosintes TaxID=39950 RepID=A0ABX9M9I5_9FIRM|nr:helix-turn-helix transcriptional regulator [Dialister pneumosintes]RID94263.1 XRE family transcriptional regulator [Dialister pneumosintes]